MQEFSSTGEKQINHVKLTVLSSVLPPAPNANAQVIQRLFEDWPTENYSFITSQVDSAYQQFGDQASQLKAKRYYTVLPAKPGKGFFSKLTGSFSYIKHFFQRVKTIVSVVRHDQFNAIMCCTGDIFDLPAGYIASRLAKVPVYVYLFDDYVYQWPHWLYRQLARFAEARVIKSAQKVIVPNEFLAKEYQKRYGIIPVVIHNPHTYASEEINAKKNADVFQQKLFLGDPQAIRIVYTGSIYHAHFDAFQNLVRAISGMDERIELHIFTAQPKDVLEKNGIVGDFVYQYPFCSPDEAKIIQQNADILFLPLAFNTPISRVIKTSAPGKMGEYLASGKPTLVHAPPDCFITWYFKFHDCGIVVDENDPILLRKKLKEGLNDQVEFERLVDHAKLRADTDFSSATAKRLFQKIFLEEKI